MAGRGSLVGFCACVILPVAVLASWSIIRDHAVGTRGWWLVDTSNRTTVCHRNQTSCEDGDDASVVTCDTCDERAGVDGVLGDVLLAKTLLTSLPAFAPVSEKVRNPECLRDSLRFLQELDNLSLWALQMHDASAKLPAGLLNGNVNQYGGYDQCLRVATPEGDFRGKYCLPSIQADLTPMASPTVRNLYKLVRSHNPFVSEPEDPGHRLPRYSGMNWGLCVPSSCTAADVRGAVEDVLEARSKGTGVAFRVKLDDSMCQVKRGWMPPLSTVVASAIFLGIILVAVVATVHDDGQDQDAKPSVLARYLSAFSLRRNVSTLLCVKRPADDIESVHGIRFLNAYMLLLSHKSMALFFDPYINRTAMAEHVGERWTLIARGASLYTDPFIMLSGLLTSYSFFKQLDRSGTLNVPKEYASRLLRLVPNLAAIILFSTFVLPFIGSGPLWNQVVKHHSDICQQHWWRNLIFVHNYFGFEHMCLTHTHHVGIDTQLFAVSPILVYVLWRWPRAGLATLVTVAGISTAMRYYVTLSRNLTNYVYYGTPVSQLFETADYSYILPTHRATVYIMGVLLGYALLKWGRDFKIKEKHTTLGWAVVSVLFYFSFIQPSTMGLLSYVYNSTEAANYAAFAPIAWCLCFAWIILLSHVGRGGVVGRILSWKGFMVSTRLSYAVYLTQFPIFFYNVGSTRSANTYSVLLLFNFAETFVIFFSSAALTVFIDLPFQNVRNLMFKKRR